MANLLRWGVLSAAAAAAVAIRLFTVFRYGASLRDHHPFFNFRVTEHLAEHGLSETLEWFDSETWYPLGRSVGGTIHPGLMLLANAIHTILSHSVMPRIELETVCIFLPPALSTLTPLATYMLATRLKDEHAGLLAASIVAVLPAYTSRTGAGAFENECIGIPLMLATFVCWLEAVEHGRMLWSAATALFYFATVASWGGHVFVINLIALYTLVLIVLGKLDSKAHAAYSIFYVLGVALAMQVPVVGEQALLSVDLSLPMIVFILCQLSPAVKSVRHCYAAAAVLDSAGGAIFAVYVAVLSAAAAVVYTVAYDTTGVLAPISTRLFMMVRPVQVDETSPLMASMSENQPSTWASFYYNLHFLTMAVPAGLHFCFGNLNKTSIFIIVYTLAGLYATGAILRMKVVLAPAASILGAVAVSDVMVSYSNLISAAQAQATQKVKKTDNQKWIATSGMYANAVMASMVLLLLSYVQHSVWVTSESYSSPPVMLKAKKGKTDFLVDDFKEGYAWLKENTPEDARIMSWWDYGYQISSFSNRTSIVDNNLWNASHIARVGLAMVSTEDRAYMLMQELDVTHVVVRFGGFIGYKSDDLSKLPWMLKIAKTAKGGSKLKPANFFTKMKEFRVDALGTPSLLNSFLYKLSYYRFGEVYTKKGQAPGYDRVRAAEAGNLDFELDTVEEVFTSKNWLVRVYKIKDPGNRGASMWSDIEL